MLTPRRQDLYQIRRHVEFVNGQPRPTRKFRRRAGALSADPRFEAVARAVAERDVHHAVLADQVVRTTTARDEVLELVREHVGLNMVKVSGAAACLKLKAGADSIPHARSDGTSTASAPGSPKAQSCPPSCVRSTTATSSRPTLRSRRRIRTLASCCATSTTSCLSRPRGTRRCGSCGS